MYCYFVFTVPCKCNCENKSLNNDGHQFYQYQQNEQSPLILTELTEHGNKTTKDCFQLLYNYTIFSNIITAPQIRKMIYVLQCQSFKCSHVIDSDYDSPVKSLKITHDYPTFPEHSFDVFIHVFPLFFIFINFVNSHAFGFPKLDSPDKIMIDG